MTDSGLRSPPNEQRADKHDMHGKEDPQNLQDLEAGQADVVSV